MHDPNDAYDVIIVGAGPAGLAAACAAAEHGLTYCVIERHGVVESLVHHPQQIRYFSPADEMAVGGVPFFVAGGHKPTREDALAYYRAVATVKSVVLHSWEEVVDVRCNGDNSNRRFSVESISRRADDGTHHYRHAHSLIVCTGTFPNPRRIDVPGEDLPNVAYRLTDPTPYFGRSVTIIGGGNSAATAGMTLAEAGAHVTIGMRRAPADFQSQLRPFIVRDLTIMADEKRLTLLAGVCARRITTTCVEFTRSSYMPSDAAIDDIRVPTDFVFIMAGHTADHTFFAHLGVPLADDGLPEYNEDTAETCIHGLFVAGSLSRANIILESRRRAVEIVQEIAARREHNHSGLASA